MRAASDSPAMFLAPQPTEAEREADADHDGDAAEMPSEFAATLGLVASSVIVSPYGPAQAHVTPPATHAAEPVGEAVDAAPVFESLPRPAGFDITSFELVASDQQVALPLEAALQHLTATIDPGPTAPAQAAVSTSAPESAPSRVITTAHEVVDVVTRHVTRGDHQITMVLKPAELGEVKVRVERVHGDHVRVTLEAEKPDATQLLRERIPELQAALQQEGVTVRSIDVSLQASDGMGQRGAGAEAAPDHQQQHNADPEETVPGDENARPQKRSKRNPKDLDVLV